MSVEAVQPIAKQIGTYMYFLMEKVTTPYKLTQFITR